MISVNVLCYGDYPQLAERCLGSIARSLPPADLPVADVRVGLNAASPATLAAVKGHLAPLLGRLPVYTYTPERNVGKYPLMRQMFRDGGLPLAKYVMWFDDDSFLTARSPLWWRDVLARFEKHKADVLGSVYRWGPGHTPGQAKKIAEQPWCRKPVIRYTHWPRFATGGWWAARTEILQKWDYPFPELHHNGGDTLLGELCFQQDYNLEHFNKGVAINFKTRESDMPRRGLVTARGFEPPLPGPEIHDFACRVCYHTAVAAVTGET